MIRNKLTLKNVLLKVAVLPSALVLFSCEKERPLAEGVLTARIEGGAAIVTKTSYDDGYSTGTYDGIGHFVWDSGDQIAVHYTTGGYKTLAVSPSTGAVNAPSTSSDMRDCYAVYPASAAVASNYGNPTLQVTLPDSYDIRSKAVFYSPLPMVALNDPYSDFLDFYHAGALLRITIAAVPSATSKVRVSFDKDITGTYDVSDPGTRTPTITTKGNTSDNAVTFTVAGSGGVGASHNPLVLNVPVPCGTYNSIKLEGLNDSNTVLVSRTYDSRTFVFSRHYGKKLFPVFSIYLTAIGEDIVWDGEIELQYE